MKKLKKKMEKLKQFNEKLKKSWKYSIVGKFIYSVCLNCREKKPGLGSKFASIIIFEFRNHLKGKV